MQLKELLCPIESRYHSCCLSVRLGGGECIIEGKKILLDLFWNCFLNSLAPFKGTMLLSEKTLTFSFLSVVDKLFCHTDIVFIESLTEKRTSLLRGRNEQYYHYAVLSEQRLTCCRAPVLILRSLSSLLLVVNDCLGDIQKAAQLPLSLNPRQ